MASDKYRVEPLFAIQPDANMNLLNMIRFSIAAASRSASPEARVLLQRHNKATLQLIKKLFPNKKGDTVVLGKNKNAGD